MAGAMSPKKIRFGYVPEFFPYAIKPPEAWHSI